jgi:hypothetical protein
VAKQQTCTDDTICIEDAGCTDCTIGMGIQLSIADTAGFVPVQPETNEGNFGWQRYRMRSVRLSADEALTQGSVALSLDGEHFSMWSIDGSELGSEASIPAADLPMEVLISATAPGRSTLSAIHTDCTGEPSTAELRSGDQPPISGYPLSEFPYFERVQVFNRDEVIRTALDPARHLDRIGLDYRVYIVGHKTPTEWAADPSLIDISLGEAESATVSAEGVAANTVDAWVAGIPIPTGLARGLDVVLDFNDNLRLDPGDIAIGPGDAVPGITVFDDLATPGPASVNMYERGSPPWSLQRVYYPSDISSRGALPLVVISHGNGHHYTWYDYLGYHLASWGFVVMSHSNNTGPGIETASTTTLTNTDSFLSGHGSDEGGVLSGHVDGSRIVWIGHSRGGEGVVRAYDRMVDEGYTTTHFGPEDIVLISSIAPTIFYSVNESDPHDRPYHLLAGAADGDVHGAPSNQYVQFFRILSAADSSSQMTYLHGVGHNEFNCCGFADATGPDLIGRTEAQIVAKSYYLALVRTYTLGDTRIRDYISRRADVFRPSGIADHVVIANTYRPDPDGDLRVLDDFQSAGPMDASAAGDLVILDVDGTYEGYLADWDSTIYYSSSDVMNGMTQAGFDYDENRGFVFRWGIGDSGRITWLVPDSMADFTRYTWFSFRAAQISRHPNTVLLGGSLSMTVVLVDGTGKEQAIPHAELGGITPPYARSYAGGVGHSNEFNTIRLRISDFGSGSSQVDLRDISAVRLVVGEDAGSSVGAIGIDDLVLEY